MIHFQLKKFQQKLISYSLSELIFIFVFTVIIIVFFVYLSMYFLVFGGNSLSNRIEDFSGFGSYLGGIGSIFSSFSLLFIIFTYRKDKQEQNYQKDEAKFFRYLDYFIESKKSIQMKVNDKIFSNNEINESFVTTIYNANRFKERKTTKNMSRHSSYKEDKDMITHFSSAYMPLYNIFIIIIKFICEDTIELNRKQSITILFSLLSNEEIIILFFLLCNIWDEQNPLLNQILNTVECNRPFYNRSKIAYDYFFS